MRNRAPQGSSGPGGFRVAFGFDESGLGGTVTLDEAGASVPRAPRAGLCRIMDESCTSTPCAALPAGESVFMSCLPS